MTDFLWGVAGAFCLDVVLLIVVVLAAPRLFKAAMRRQTAAMLGFGAKPAGAGKLSASIDEAGRTAYEARNRFPSDRTTST